MGVNKESTQDFDQKKNWNVSLSGLDNKGYIPTTVNDVINGLAQVAYLMTFGLACCAVEMMHTNSPI